MSLECFSRIAVMTATLAALSPVLAWADCGTRHFYNNSPQSFSLDMGDGAGSCSYANSGMQKDCVIPPGQVGEIHYANNTLDNVAVTLHGDAEPTGGFVRIKSNGGGLYNEAFTVAPDSCRINHDGTTGNVSLNEPANGDIVTCGKNGFSCTSIFGNFTPH